MKDSPIRVCLIEDHNIVRAGLKVLIEAQADMQVVADAIDRKTSFEAVSSHKPDILVVDLHLRNESALDFLQDLLAVNNARAIALTGSTEQDVVHRAISAGANGLVYKDEDPGILIRAIRAVHKGESWLTRSVMTDTLSRLRDSHLSKTKPDPESVKIATLTAREREIIGLLASGLNRHEVAEKLFLSDGTIRNHLSSVFAKLGLPNQLALVFFAQKHGLDKPGDKEAETKPLSHRTGRGF